MHPTSPWLDIHRPSGPQPHAPLVPTGVDEPTAVPPTDEASRTNPWENVEAATRPSRTTVESPSSDRSADD